MDDNNSQSSDTTSRCDNSSSRSSSDSSESEEDDEILEHLICLVNKHHPASKFQAMTLLTPLHSPLSISLPLFIADE